MSEPLLDLAQQLIDLARRRGLTQVKVIAQRNRQCVAEFHGSTLERVRESTAQSIELSLLLDGRYSCHSTSDLRLSALETLLDEARAQTALLRPDPHRVLPPPQRFPQGDASPLALFDAQGLTLAPSERQQLAQRMDDTARALPGAHRIVSVSTSYSQSHAQSAIVTSHGLRAYQQGTVFGLEGGVTVRGGANRKPFAVWFADSRSQKGLPAVESIAQQAARRALLRLGARPRPSGNYPCIVENIAVRRLLSGLLEAMRGQGLQQKRSFLLGKRGETIAGPALTLLDDPSRPRGLGSRLFDSEGLGNLQLELIRQGRLLNYYVDTYYAHKLGIEPTTADSSNLIVAPGQRSLSELCKALGRGILITGFSGGSSNAVTGDFSIGISGHWIENGQIAQPISEMNISDNHQLFWKKLIEVGSDVFPHSALASPSLRFEPVHFSGA